MLLQLFDGASLEFIDVYIRTSIKENANYFWHWWNFSLAYPSMYITLKLPKIFTKSPLGQTIGGEEGGIESYCDTDKCVVQ